MTTSVTQKEKGMDTELLYSFCYQLAKRELSGIKRRPHGSMFTHGVRVAEMFTDHYARCVGVLHDIIEDTGMTAEKLSRCRACFGTSVEISYAEHASDDLRVQYKIPKGIIEGVVTLTHLPFEPREQYIDRICKDKKLIRIKIADITDNLMDAPSSHAKEKYRRDMVKLLKAL